MQIINIINMLIHYISYLKHKLTRMPWFILLPIMIHLCKINANAYDEFVSIASKAISSVVIIRGSIEAGTGVFISTWGHVLTNAHVVRFTEHEAVIIYPGFSLNSFEILKSSPEVDLALLKLADDTKTIPVEFEKSNAVMGEEIIIIGNPWNMGWLLTKTVISAIKEERNRTFIVMQGAAWPGSSGSPVINSRGHCIGVVAAYLNMVTKERFTVAIPFNTIREFLKDTEMNKI